VRKVSSPGCDSGKCLEEWKKDSGPWCDSEKCPEECERIVEQSVTLGGGVDAWLAMRRNEKGQ